MITYWRIFSIVLLMGWLSGAALAQDSGDPSVSGTVMTEKGELLQGVTISAKESAGKAVIHSVTDARGVFHLAGLKAGAVYDLLFTYTGYEDNVVKGFRVREGNGNSMLIRMKQTGSSMNEVVVIGYGTQSKKDVTTSVSSLKAADINNFPATGLDKAMTGKMAGVQVLQPAGAPGAGISIMIRGRGTITAGSDPLYVIDGVPLSDNDAKANNINGPLNGSVNGVGMKVNPLNAINVNDIESVDVLKDASAAAIYGSRGANGVIVITTKRGRKDRPSVSYNGYAGVQRPLRKIPMLNAYQYAQLIYDAHNNTYFDLLQDKGLTGTEDDDNATRLSKLLGAPGSTSQAYLLPPEIFPYLSGQKGLTDINWQDQVFRTAPQQSHSISVSGGSENVRYYLSGNYLDQRGIVLNSGYRKYGGRINLDATYGKLRLGATVNYNYATYDNQQTEGRFNGNLENVISAALVAAPFFPVYNSDGSYNYDQYKWQYSQAQLINPVALALLKSDNTYENKFLSNIFAEYEILKDLRIRTSFGTDISNADRNAFRPSTLPNPLTLATPSIPTGNYRTSDITNWVMENTLSYNKKWGGHTVQAIGGFTAQRERSQSSNIAATGYPNDLVKTLNAATSITSWTSNINEWSLLSALARVQYNYRGKYLLSAALRRDGSSRFGPRKKWGSFPSASIGWNLSDEPFMQNNKAISSWKLRASFGVTGNFQIGNYAYLATLSTDNYIFGPQGSTAQSSGLYQGTPSNPDLGWEKTSAFNIGTDIGLFGEQLHATVDVYNNNTNNLLLNVPVPLSSGYSTNLINIGRVNNKGVEIALSHEADLGKLKWSNSVNYSMNRNKVVDLGGVNSIVTQAESVIYFITQVGKPVGNYYTLVKTGIFKDQAEIDDPKNAKVPGAKPGDFKFRDINGDGTIDGSNDRAITGNYMPKFTYGYSTRIQYGIFELSASLQGIYGNTVANVNKRHMDAIESYGNNTTDALYRWKSPSDPGNGIIARANRNQRGLNATISTYHLEDGSYARVRDITFGVTIPSKYAKRIGMTGVRAYFTALNPFTFTGYSGYNPEVSNDDNTLTPGIDYGTYPLAKSYLFGLNINF